MPRTVRRRPFWPWLVLLVVSLGLAGTIAWRMWPRLPEPRSLGPRQATPQPPPRPASSERLRIRLFFPHESAETLKEQERDISRRATLAENVRAALHELSGGSQPGVRPPLPAGTQVRQVFLDAFGILYLDFSKGVPAVVSGLGDQPELAISAIVTTLTTSFSEVKRVQFLAEGQEIPIVAGGVDLRRPIRPRFPGEEAPPIISQPQE